MDVFESDHRDNILSGKRESRNKDEGFEFEDNFGDFNKKKTPKNDFNFAFDEKTNFDDQFAEQPKPNKMDDFKFDFGDEEKQDAPSVVDPFQNEGPSEEARPEPEAPEESVRVEPRPSENIDFEDPFNTEVGGTEKDEAFDMFEKDSSERRRESHNDTREEPVHSSAGRKK